MSRNEDDHLMRQIAKGDKTAFRDLFKKHGGHVVGYASRYLSAPDRAEDAAQEVWIKVVRLASSYDGKGHFVAWIYTMIRNHCLNELRAQKRLVVTAPTSSGDDDAPNVFETLPDGKDLEAEILKKENFAKLKTKIDGLPEQQRVALLLYAVEDLSYEDIAREMETSIPSVKSLIFRARKQLAEVS